MAGKRRFFVDRELLESMYQSMTMRQIADHFGCGETVVWKRIHEAGIKLKGHENPRCRPKEFTEQHIAALRESGKRRRGKFVGENSYNWRGGMTDANRALRGSGAYSEWKRTALDLAGNKCQSCGDVRGRICECCGHKTTLHVHHVRSFAKHPELRFDPTNSEVLCTKCHNSRHNGKLGEFGETPNA